MGPKTAPMYPPDEDAWRAWTPQDLALRLSGLACPWYVVGGWALDLHLGCQSRDHDDLEFAVLPQHAQEVAAKLSELTFFAAQQGGLRYWSGAAPVGADICQLWGADHEAQQWRVDMMMERGSAQDWVYKRDSIIRQPRSSAVRVGGQGIPYLAPENVLLFKAKYLRPKDQQDFEMVAPTLCLEGRIRLRNWLALQQPGHKWIVSLS